MSPSRDPGLLEDQLRAELETRRAADLLRFEHPLSSAPGPEVQMEGRRYLHFCSNNYLGLADHREVIEAAQHAALRFGAGSGASRLISGTCELALRLESSLAEFKQTEAAIVFSSGYLANCGLLASLAQKPDMLFLDKLCHASLIDAGRLSDAMMRVYPHKNLDALERLLQGAEKARRRIIVTDGVFSMDGDIAPIHDLLELADKYNAYLIVDDAHGFGVFGEHGRGTAEQFRAEKNPRLIQVGTLSKALGSAGGFVTGTKALIEFLRNTARTYMFDTAPSPAALGAAAKALEILGREPDRRKRLWNWVSWLQKDLTRHGWDLTSSESPIMPLVI
ncbi:MAG: 8-amino-7-oxononanoate synthase, partial [bacterium]